MDYNALQHKLFAMDPPSKRRFSKIKTTNRWRCPIPIIDYIAESAVVPAVLQMDLTCR